MKRLFKITSIILIQAFLVMDFAWAAGGDFFGSEYKASADTLQPQLQLDAQVLKNVFLYSTDNPQRTLELTATDDTKVQNNRSGLFSMPAAVKNLVLTAALFVIVVLPFAAPAFFNAAQARAQAPPAITYTQQETISRLIKISKQSDHKQLDKIGALTTIRADIRKNELVFSNSKARERVRQINELADKLWKEGKEAGTLHEYITKRGDSEEAIAIEKALLLIQIFDEETFEALYRDKVPIYLADIPEAGYVDVRGRWRGFGGRPVIYLNKELKDNIFWLADILVHEAVHSDRLPKNLLDFVFKHNIFTFFRDWWSNSVPEEEDAFLKEAVFIKNFEIIPIDKRAKAFFDEYDLATPYYNYKWSNILIDIVGTFLFNIIPFVFGWGLIKLFMRKMRNRGSGTSYRRSGGSVLSQQRPTRRRDSGNGFRLIIFLPLLGLFQSLDFFNPEVSLASSFGQIVSEGSGIGLILAAVFVGVSVIGTSGWMILGRLRGSNQAQQDDEFNYPRYNWEDWIEVLEDNGLQQVNIDHVERNVCAVEYFGEKENLNDREMEILKVSFWMHDLSKDTPIDQYRLRYMPQDPELAEIIQSLYERNLDDPKQAEQFLKEKGHQEDLIGEVKSVLNRNMKLAGTLRLLIHHLESAAHAREILAELGYGENFINQVESIIIRHMGPIMGKERAGFMEFTRTTNIEAIENGLRNSNLPLARKEQLMDYVVLLKRPFPGPITKLELIARDIDLLDLAGAGVVKVVMFRQTLPDFFVDGRPENIKASFNSAMQSAEDVRVNVGTDTAEALIDAMITRLENYKTYMQANGTWNLITAVDNSTKLKIFTKKYNDFMQENLFEYDLALKGEPVGGEIPGEHIDGLTKTRVNKGVTNNNGVSKEYIINSIKVTSNKGKLQQRRFNEDKIGLSI